MTLYEFSGVGEEMCAHVGSIPGAQRPLAVRWPQAGCKVAGPWGGGRRPCLELLGVGLGRGGAMRQALIRQMSSILACSGLNGGDGLVDLHASSSATLPLANCSYPGVVCA